MDFRDSDENEPVKGRRTWIDALFLQIRPDCQIDAKLNWKACPVYCEGVIFAGKNDLYSERVKGCCYIKVPFSY
jgi:hypothetical protein